MHFNVGRGLACIILSCYLILGDFEKRSEQEDGSSKGSRDVWSCIEKESFKIHRQTQLNIASGRFLQRTKLVAHSR